MKQIDPDELTLAQVWKLHLEQWKWIVEQIDAGSELRVTDLKDQWMKLHGLEDCVLHDCFFCHYTRHTDIDGSLWIDCSRCPGRQVNRKFRCENKTYHYFNHPHAFLRKSRELNAQRLAQKRQARAARAKK